MDRKLKVVLLCHFSNKEIQRKLRIKNSINEFAPWIPPLIEIFENDETVQLYVIAPHKYIYNNHSFNLRGIEYHFFHINIPFLLRPWPDFFKLPVLTNYSCNKKRVRRILKKINPDIIHLFGAENSYYSSTILQFSKKYPILVSIQGFINKAHIKENYIIKSSKRIEEKILHLMTHFGVSTETMGKDLISFNKKATILKVNYPILIPQLEAERKKFDIVFFARILKEKGIGDLIEALSIIKLHKPDISLCVIGGGRLEQWKELATSLNVQNNIFWAGFLPTQEDVHKLASQAKICVLPTYHEIISGTIIESLFLKIPVVAYNVGSIHEVNNNNEIIELIDKLDVVGLANGILKLLDNNILRNKRAELGYKRVKEMFNYSNGEIKSNLVKVYQTVINDFNKE